MKISCWLFCLIFLLTLSLHAQDEMQFELTKINFEGNSNIPSKVLSSILKSKESPNNIFQFINKFTSLGAPPVYIDFSLVETDTRNITALYNSRGFFKTRVDYYYSLDSANLSADLTYLVAEGPQAVMGKVKLHGLSEYPQSDYWQINDRVLVREGQAYSQDRVLESINGVLMYLKSQGYLLSNYDSTVVVKDTLIDRAYVDIFFSLGKKYYIDSVQVSTGGPGKSDVDDDMLRDLTGISPGEIFDITKITQAQVRLYRTGLFSYVRIYPGLDGIKESSVPVKLDGNIAMMNDLNPELIMNNIQNAFNFGVGLEFNRKNFLGGARRFTSRAQINYQDLFSLNFERLFSLISLSDTVTTGAAEFKVRIEQPYFLGQPIFASLEFSSLIQKIKYLQGLTYKGKVNFEFELPKFTFFNSMNLFYALEYNKLTVISERLGNPVSDLMSAGFGAQLVSNHVDDFIFPTEGSNYSLYLEEGNLFPYLFSKIFTGEYLSLLFLKSQATASYYLSLSSVNDLVFGVKFSAGYIATLSGDKNAVPYIKEFFVGGSNSVRGWSSRAFPPQKGLSEGLDENSIPGGRILTEGSLELRKRFNDLIGMAAFVDWGNTWKEISNVKISEVAVAAGFGFRFYTQIAAFRLDFGFKVYDPYDRTPIPERRFFDLMQFHFGIGEAF